MIVLAVIALVAVGLVVRSMTRTAEQPAAVSTTNAPSATVHLSADQTTSAGIHVALVARGEVQQEVRVPGKIGYNASRRLEIKLPAGGVVKHVRVMPGEEVKEGDELAILTSVEVGLARDEVDRYQADVHLAQHEYDWNHQIATNLKTLLTMLDQRPEVSDVESQYKDRVLGDHRGSILSAYSKLLLAERIWSNTESMLARGAISERLVQERKSDREVTTAHYASVCEQARFDAHHKEDQTRANLEHAERVLAVSRQRLRLLLGPFAEIADSAEDSTICELVLRAPISGVIEERYVSEGMQLAASQKLFTLANTETLWVSAQIYEREWAALAGSNVREVRVESPAVPGEVVTARVQFTGVGVSPETHAVPLVAEMPNAQRHFKPGMFAWIDVPVGAKHEGLLIRASAVMRNGDETFVFIEDEPGNYRKVDVKLGVSTRNDIEVTDGLSAGDRVVDSGAFQLKSELMLGNEPD
ncbi:MAG TPA: efflux RND transporter periplasmic adaptor subunit [Pirellulales bacterium]|nr:efflux RND transporter periplasmic adaptor subunit [Pirellulales bacterium]